MRKLLLILIFFTTGSVAMAQERTITGRVVDEDGTSPLPGATILVKGTNVGTITDAEGTYTIRVPAGNDVLTISSIGYKTQELNIGTRSIIDVSMAVSVSQLSEVVVIGYGSREKKDLTGSIGVVDEEALGRVSAMTPQLALQGNVSGVQVINNSGRPGEEPTIRIRGLGTFNDSKPLYVVDGQIIESSTHENDDLTGTVNLWTLINPNDIASMTVLKDATASAIYGSRASAGVILITTKRGKTGRPRVSYDNTIGWQNVPAPDVMDVSGYTALYQEAYANHHDPGVRDLLPAEFQPSNPAYLGNRPTTDWFGAIQNKNALSQNHSLKVSGGTESMDYFVSGGFQQQESPLIGNDMSRYSMSANVNTQIGEYIKAGMIWRGAYQKSQDQSLDYGSVFGNPTWQAIYDDSHPTGFAPALRRNADDELEVIWGPHTRNNALAYQSLNTRFYEQIRNQGNTYLEVTPFDGFRIRGTANIDFILSNRESGTNNQYGYLFSYQPVEPSELGDGTSLGTYSYRMNRFINRQLDLLLNYTKSFGDHNLDLLFNASDQRFNRFTNDGSSQQQFSTDFDKQGVGAGAPEDRGGFTDKERNNWIGYVGRASYNFSSRYYLDLSLRRDGSSGFPEDYRWDWFPAFGAAWRISSENFMQGVSLINDLKLRGGWGVTGNDRPTRGAFAYLSTISTSPDYSFGSGNGDPIGAQTFGTRLPRFPILDLGWEKAETTTVGFDALLLNNTVNFSLEYYQRIDRDLLQFVDFPANVGVEQSPLINVATVRNRGIELALGYSGNVGEVTYNVSGNLSTVNNEVMEIYNDQPFGDEYGRVETGFPLNYLWGYQMGGVFQTAAEVATYLDTYSVAVDTLVPGDAYFLDVHGNPTEEERFYSTTPDGVINNNDRAYIGKTIPGYTYGLSITAAFKGLDLSLSFYGEGDVQKYNDMRARGQSMSSNGSQVLTSVNNRWTPSNPSGDFPRAVFGDPASNNRFSTRWVENASFFRLNNWQVGYSLPQSLIGPTNVFEKLRVFVGGQNNILITNWSSIDPVNDYYPLPRMIMIGVNAGF